MSQIINSLLDTDYYKFTMGQFAWKNFPNVKVKYAFKNRTKNIKLGDTINKEKLLEELDHVRSLRFTMDELNYLKGLGIFCNDYLSFLNNLTLPPVYVDIKDGELVIETEGLWSEAIFWETFILSIVNELYCEQCREGRILSGNIELSNKIDILNNSSVKFVDFGTRRRFSRVWHNLVISTLTTEITNKSFLGTSNVYLAKKYGIKPIGTLAHELPMVLAGINDYNLDVLKDSHDKMLTLWEFMYVKI